MIINLLFIITGFLGFLTLIIILASFRRNKTINFYLILIFTLISIRFLLSGFFSFGYLVYLKEHYINYCKFLILIIPSLYLYFKNLIADQKLFMKADLVHYIFPLAFLAINLSVVSTNYFLPPSFYFSFFLVLILYTITYFFLAYQILNKNVWAKKNGESNSKHSILIKKWNLFLFIIVLIISLKLFATLFLVNDYRSGFVAADRFQWIGAIIWIITFFRVLISPELLYGYPIFDIMKETKKVNLLLDTDWIVEFNKEQKKDQDSKLQEKIDKYIIRYINEIEEISRKFELFQDSKFSIVDLAIKLNIPNSHLNYLFKYHSKISFLDYKKKIRIYRSILLIESNYLKTNTMDSLAKEVGFASYNPFFTSFKNVTGISPQKYIIKKNDF
ncbi:AraC family transcriptional regulator [Flavobacterium sp. GSP27]|uniref:helix-turn-helix domain-containing protein n=1 Tax=Flavobacterium sp. GSP27 TaxID=2497489 RepID=UPI000F846FB7|nr:helix-turn-helix domain-containing protein [Flavobacterium sp. GSP27]RTY93850.1 AraC family transcriptional regulator [Flavobacterium sp. GSN2]RTZ08881.1 AraC family transcriptional regulator [Flavobacterium sp. GSP27]